MGEFGKYKGAIARNNHSMEVQELQSKIEQLNKTVITQGQKFNDQAQELKSALYKIEQLEKINAKNQNTLQHLECEYLRVIAENKALRGES